MTDRTPIRYTILPEQPEAHLFTVTCRLEDPDPGGQRFALPAWIPGSYLIRDFARNVVTARAQAVRRRVPIRKLDKQTWVAAAVTGPLTVTLQVYAHDLSVRSAHLDTSHAFFNGSSVFLCPLGKEARPCEVEILPPRGTRYRGWRVATSMRRKRAPVHGFGLYRAESYDELIDHPVELGSFTLATFEVHGVRHEIALTGRHDADLDRLSRDLHRLCQSHVAMFGGMPPMEKYVFLITALGEGYGGLEHRSSTALLCSREDLPRPGTRATGSRYRTFLGLCSHEYFHAWNVKRIKPAAFVPYDLERENYTHLLWAFEGMTSYYDDLQLVRSGLISELDYLEILGRNMTSLLRTAGRLKQTVEEASFDAWIKYYRPDENSPNAQVSYYLKGSLIALCLDLLIRTRTRGKRSLDDVMRALWKRYGQSSDGVPEDGIEKIASQVAGVSLRSFFDRALRTTEELPLKRVLASAGIVMQLRRAQSPGDQGGKAADSDGARRVSLGVRTAEDSAGVRLTHVLDAGAAQAAGLSAGDVIVAIDGLKVNVKTLELRLVHYLPGDVVTLHAFRRDELMAFKVELRASPLDTCALVIEASNRPAASRRRSWLQVKSAGGDVG